MALHVVVVAHARGQRTQADLALEEHVLGVRQHVVLELVALLELLVAVLARVRTLVRVRPDVALQSIGPVEDAVAVLALLLLPVALVVHRALVAVQGLHVRVRFVALLAMEVADSVGEGGLLFRRRRYSASGLDVSLCLRRASSLPVHDSPFLRHSFGRCCRRFDHGTFGWGARSLGR